MLLLALFGATSFFANSQTKGTNAVGLGVGISKVEHTGPDLNTTQTANNYSLSYGIFIKENIKLRIGGNYVHSKNIREDSPNTSSDTGYGGYIEYQKYFPVFKKLYVFVGGGPGFNHSVNKYADAGQSHVSGKHNQYSLGANGGVAYFLSKRFALEAQLLKANAYYTNYKSGNDLNSVYKSNLKSFNLSSSGTLNNMNFQIFFLF